MSRGWGASRTGSYGSNGSNGSNGNNGSNKLVNVNY